MQGLHEASGEEVLRALGLRRQRSALEIAAPALGLFAAGVLVGTGVALLLAPKSGKEMRRDLKGKATDARKRLSEATAELAHEARSALPFGEEKTEPGRGNRRHESSTRE